MKEPIPMQEVHQWRRRIYEEEKHLSREQRLENIKHNALEAARKYGLKIRRAKKAA
ncbi:MAG: hypothetical protein HY586_03030 [Candidatus Omnitrophica bacterium]|nr:hypothetical protein [Candidatus Omnitrophota bacterium]